jgi:hypothetical protein
VKGAPLASGANQAVGHGQVQSAGLAPELSGDRSWNNFDRLPPGLFIAAAVQIAMVQAAQRNGELVADLPAQGARLSEAEMVGVQGALGGSLLRPPR